MKNARLLLLCVVLLLGVQKSYLYSFSDRLHANLKRRSKRLSFPSNSSETMVQRDEKKGVSISSTGLTDITDVLRKIQKVRDDRNKNISFEKEQGKENDKISNALDVGKNNDGIKLNKKEERLNNVDGVSTAEIRERKNDVKNELSDQSSTTSNSLGDKKILKGIIEVKSHEKVPQMRLLFAGQQTTSIEEGVYSFILENDLDSFYILIANRIHQHFENINTIAYLSVNPSKKYRFFKIRKIFLKDNKYRWEWEECSLHQNNFIIPNNCLILLINPKYFDSLQEWRITLDDNFLAVPKIVLSTNFGSKKIFRNGFKSILYNLDANYFHENIREVRKKDNENPLRYMTLIK